jgi:hypothetical protein
LKRENGSKPFTKKILIGLRFEIIRLKIKIRKTINAMLSVKTGRLYPDMVKKYKRYENIDRIATMEKIKDMYYDAESQSINETHGILEEENRTKTVVRLEEKKREGDELEELDVVLKDRRLPNITFDRKITSTTSDDNGNRFKMLWIISKTWRCWIRMG